MIEALSLHDATLKAVRFAWAEGRCVLELSSFEAPECELIFTDVSELHVPRHYPWGPSVSVNAVRRIRDSTFEVELQSGDVLRIEASAWSFHSNATVLLSNDRFGNDGL
jgi:hypothetical protein